jgi:hypothetical protein
VSPIEENPLFDSSKKALAFAVNHTRMLYSQPLMTKAANYLADQSDPDKKSVIQKPFSLAGLDGAAQAGMIYAQLNKLSDFQIYVLIGRVAKPTFPCSCRSACCMGVRPNPEWTGAIKQISDMVRDEVAAQQEKKKKKTSTAPQLRRMLVEKYFGRNYVLADLAEQFQVTEATVISHRKPITDILNGVERSGWTALDSYLTELGIVGAIV